MNGKVYRYDTEIELQKYWVESIKLRVRRTFLYGGLFFLTLSLTLISENLRDLITLPFNNTIAYGYLDTKNLDRDFGFLKIYRVNVIYIHENSVYKLPSFLIDYNAECDNPNSVENSYFIPPILCKFLIETGYDRLDSENDIIPIRIRLDNPNKGMPYLSGGIIYSIAIVFFFLTVSSISLFIYNLFKMNVEFRYLYGTTISIPIIKILTINSRLEYNDNKNNGST
ncbi:MAG: hypothetical protein NZM04_01040 [Methylacidiphilales bacterium]|nr:hypothetical protein [Candidatus Methylacidiphilales bacterium]